MPSSSCRDARKKNTACELAALHACRFHLLKALLASLQPCMRALKHVIAFSLTAGSVGRRRGSCLGFWGGLKVIRAGYSKLWKNIGHLSKFNNPICLCSISGLSYVV